MKHNAELKAEEKYDESRILYGCREIYDYEGNREKVVNDKKKIRYCGNLRKFIQDYKDYIEEFYS